VDSTNSNILPEIVATLAEFAGSDGLESGASCVKSGRSSRLEFGPITPILMVLVGFVFNSMVAGVGKLLKQQNECAGGWNVRLPSTEEFVGSNQASATKSSTSPISSEYPATIRIDKIEVRKPERVDIETMPHTIFTRKNRA
jgi:hypothetical protein